MIRFFHFPLWICKWIGALGIVTWLVCVFLSMVIALPFAILVNKSDELLKEIK